MSAIRFIQDKKEEQVYLNYTSEEYEIFMKYSELHGKSRNVIRKT